MITHASSQSAGHTGKPKSSDKRLTNNLTDQQEPERALNKGTLRTHGLLGTSGVGPTQPRPGSTVARVCLGSKNCPDFGTPLGPHPPQTKAGRPDEPQSVPPPNTSRTRYLELFPVYNTGLLFAKEAPVQKKTNKFGGKLLRLVCKFACLRCVHNQSLPPNATRRDLQAFKSKTRKQSFEHWRVSGLIFSEKFRSDHKPVPPFGHQ